MTTIVVLSRSDSSAICACVRSASAACASTQCARGDMPISASAAVIRVVSTCAVCWSRKETSGAPDAVSAVPAVVAVPAVAVVTVAVPAALSLLSLMARG